MLVNNLDSTIYTGDDLINLLNDDFCIEMNATQVVFRYAKESLTDFHYGIFYDGTIIDAVSGAIVDITAVNYLALRTVWNDLTSTIKRI